MESLIFAVLNAILTSSILSIWFNTNFREHILKRLGIIPQYIFTATEINDYLILKRGLLGDLLTCPICLGTWISIFWSFFLTFCLTYEWYYAIVGSFSPQIFIRLLFNKDIK